MRTLAGAQAHSKQLKRQQQQQADAVAAAEQLRQATVAAATAGQKAAALRMKHKMAQVSPTKGELQKAGETGWQFHSCRVGVSAFELKLCNLAALSQCYTRTVTISSRSQMVSSWHQDLPVCV